MRDEPPHNRFKLPFFVVGLVIGLVWLVERVSEGAWVGAAGAAVVVALAVPAIVTIRRGRNPWWLRAPLDRR